MTFQPCPGVAAVTLKFSLPDGQQGVNTFYVANDDETPWGASDLHLLATAFGTWWGVGDGSGNTYRAHVSNGVTLDTVTARDLLLPGGAESVVTVALAGQATDAHLNNGLTLSISERTGHAGRSMRGRKYVVGLTAAALNSSDTNLIAAGVASGLLLAFNSLRAAVTAYGGTATATLSVLSRVNKDDVPTPPHIRSLGIATPVTLYQVVDLFVDFQRRRAPGHNR